jgi:predicted dehydrogenase
MSHPQNNVIRLACVGGSVRSAVGRAHLAALSMDNRFKVVAGCFSREYDIGVETGQRIGVDPSRIYKDVDSMLEVESQEVDAILVISPTDQHYQHVQKALKSKLFVICEKALATSSQEIENLVKLSEEMEKDIVVVYNYLGYPMVRELRHRIRQGALGKIQQIQIEMPQEGFAKLKSDHTPHTPQSWRLSDFKTVSAVSLDLGVHVHSLISYLTGLSPEKVVANCGSLGNFSEIMDNVNCLAEFRESLACNIWYGKVALGYSNGLRVRVFGEIGSAEWIQQYPEELFLSDVYGNRSVIDRGSNQVTVGSDPRYSRFKVGHPAGFIEALSNFYLDVAEIYYSKKPNSFEGEYGIYHPRTALEGLRMLEAIEASSHSGKWETV